MRGGAGEIVWGGNKVIERFFYDASYIHLELHSFSLKHSLAAGHVSPPWSKRSVTGNLDLLLDVHRTPSGHGPRSRHPSPGAPPNSIVGARMFSADVFCLVFGFLLPLQHLLRTGQGETAPGLPAFPGPKSKSQAQKRHRPRAGGEVQAVSPGAALLQLKEK